MKIPGPERDRMRKDLIKLFQKYGLKITLEMKLLKANYLDVKFDIEKNEYGPYRKPNSQLIYINSKSNHPPTVLKQVPKTINNRLNSISCNKDIFNKAKGEYEQALKESGYDTKLEFCEKNTDKQQTKKRRRNVIWFNPPYNASVKTNLGRKFLTLIDKHFPKSSTLYKIINRKKVKISYSCTSNMKKIMQSHNHKILNSNNNQENKRDCNCRNKQTCPLNGKCLEESLIYEATLKHNDNEVKYLGCTEGPFKTRYNNHTHSFREESKKSSTSLSLHIWENNLNPNPSVKWKILEKCKAYSPGSKFCNLCISEKMHIIKNINNKNSLNKHTEIGRRCVHVRKHTLGNFKRRKK